MDNEANVTMERQLSHWVSIGIVAAAALMGLVVLYHVNHYPRTDDAEIFANFIGIAPQVEGPITHLNVRDNQFVQKGQLLYEIDERPYQYKLETAISEQAALEGQIVDETRRIAALVSAVSVSRRERMWPMPNKAYNGLRPSGPTRVTICIGSSRFSPSSLLL